MLLHMENFEGFVIPGPGRADTRWIGRYYDFVGDPSRPNTGTSPNLTTYPYLAIQEYVEGPEPRTGVTVAGGNTNNPWAMLVSLREGFLGVPATPRTVYVGAKLLGVPPSVSTGSSNQCLWALVDREGTQMKGVIFYLGIVDRSTLRLHYVENGRTVRRLIPLPVPMFGTYDTLEVGITKQDLEPGTRTPLSIWVNNRVVFSESVVSNVGDPQNLWWAAVGTIAAVDGDLARPDTYVTGPNLEPSRSSVPFGITDFVITNNAGTQNNVRPGRVRVTSRLSTQDQGTNQWAPRPDSEAVSHAEIVGAVPPSTGEYLETQTPSLVELYGAEPFPALGSEAVMGIEVRAVASKTDPLGPDFRTLLRSGASTINGEVVPLVPDGSYAKLIVEQNPVTGLPWQASEANGTVFGFESVDSTQE